MISPRPLLALCGLLLGLLAPTASRAQNATPAAAPATLNLRFMSWEQPVKDLFLRDAKGDFIPVTIPAYNWGPTFEISIKGDTLALYREVEQDGVKTHQVATEARLEAGCREFQVALVRQNGEQPYRMIPLPRDLHVFGAGTVRVFNFSPHPIAVRLGETEIQLAPLQWRFANVSPDNKYRVVMLSAIQLAGEWVSGGNRVISLRPDHRGDLMIIHSGTRADLAPGASTDTADATQVLIETEFISPRLRRLSAAN